MKNISSLQNKECKTQNTRRKKYLLSAGSWRQSCFWLQREQVLHTEAPARNQNGALVKTHPISLEIKIPVGRIPGLQVVIFLLGNVGGDSRTNKLQVDTWLGTRHNSVQAVQPQSKRMPTSFNFRNGICLKFDLFGEQTIVQFLIRQSKILCSS